MPTIYDNNPRRLSTGLDQFARGEEALDVCVGYFNIRGWGVLADVARSLTPPDSRPASRILIGMLSRPDYELREDLKNAALAAKGVAIAVDGKRMQAELDRLIDDFRTQLVIGIPTKHDLVTLVDLRDGLRAGRVAVKAYLGGRLHAKLFVAHRRDAAARRVAFVGSSNLTQAGLERQGELNIDVLDQKAAGDLAIWFEDRWEDINARNISTELADLIDASWIQQTDPYLVHLKLAYHLSRDAREGQAAFEIPPDIASELLDFQSAAVRMSARTLQRRRGVMIGDVVGLGKTLTATALARVMEEEDRVETLILCPKNLERMWLEYVREYQLRGARVLPLSMARTQLADFARYRLVVIDEAHNLRNAGGQTYNAVRDYIERNEPYVVLITATPYNVDFSDIADQLALFVSPDDRLPLRPERAIAAAGGLAPFMQRVRNGIPESLDAFRRSEDPEDWRALMSQFLVRRTRAFIKKHYAKTDERGAYLVYPGSDDHRFYFPKRVPRVVRIESAADDENRVADLTIDVVAHLHLARQRLGDYLTPAARASNDEVVQRLLNRSGVLQGIVRIGLLKRLSSSRAALLLSLERHLVRDLAFRHAISQGLRIPVGAGTLVDADLVAGDGSGVALDGQRSYGDSNALDKKLRVSKHGVVGPLTLDEGRGLAAAAYQRVEKRASGVTWLEAGLVEPERLLRALDEDIAAVLRLIDEIGVVRAADDPKITELARLVRREHPTEKLLVFTEYRDTAEYVTAGLENENVEHLGLVTGDDADPTTFARRFSPRSNAKIGGLPAGRSELRVLVATDVLSEGQNLQDARIVVNFDLPWATIRLVQRAGRVDRIGQESSEVIVYTFDVLDGLDGLLRLRRRLVRRLNEAGAVLGSDDRFFGSEIERELLEGLYDEKKANNLDDLASVDVDPSSYAYELWRAAVALDPSVETVVTSLPMGVRTTLAASGAAPAGGVLAVLSSEHGMTSVVRAEAAGEARPVPPIDALASTVCDPGTPMLTALGDHLSLLGDCYDRVADDRQGQTGILTGVRKRVYERLAAHERIREGLFTDRDARVVVDELYHRPLSQAAAQKLDAKLRDKSDGLLELLLALAADGSLFVAEEELSGGELQIVGSVGYRGTKR